MASVDNIDLHESSTDDNYIGDQFVSLLTSLGQIKTFIMTVTSQVKLLEKTVKKEIKHNKKDTVNKNPVKGNRKPSGFASASPISNELCEFMGKDLGTNIARTDVTRFVCSYIKEHSLTDAMNNKVIKPDTKLKLLLGTDDETVITYFNIQRFMNRHFVRNSSTVKITK